VLLLDDVATSGSTLDACAAVLKACGANAVWGLVMAREI
jgi:predicted amidophosphoribosyltransferase